jgi:DNA-binding GntR family transcriptional regulator
MVKFLAPNAQEKPQMPRRMTFTQIADDLAARIESGEYPPHTELPSTRQLADLYSVSVGTIDKVHIVLRQRGLTYGVPGRGVFVEDRAET